MIILFYCTTTYHLSRDNQPVDSDMIFTAQCRSSLNVQHHVYIHVPPGATNNSPTQQILLSGTIIITLCHHVC